MKEIRTYEELNDHISTFTDYDQLLKDAAFNVYLKEFQTEFNEQEVNKLLAITKNILSKCSV